MSLEPGHQVIARYDGNPSTSMLDVRKGFFIARMDRFDVLGDAHPEALCLPREATMFYRARFIAFGLLAVCV